MVAVWYYARGGAQTGPVSFDELKAAVAAGQLAREDLVWKEGTADWVPAQHVAGLFPASPADPPLSATQPIPPPRLPGAAPAPAPAAAPAAAGAPLSIYDEARDWPTGEKPGAAEIASLAKEFFRRTIAANPSAIAPNPVEEKLLTKAGYDATTRKFAAWRRAVLWVSVVPTAFAAFFGLITLLDMERDQKKAMSDFGMLLLYLQTFSLFALPASAVLAALAFDKLTKSARLVLLGGIISLGVPILVAFVPATTLLELPKEEAEGQRALIGLLFGLSFYLTLMPLVLSLLPAVTRACVRLKTFLPESLVPGWGLVASVPLFFLLTLVTFVLLYQFVGNFLLVLALILWIGAPLVYLTKFKLLTRPVTESQDIAALAKTQLLVFGTIAVGILLLVIYMFTAKFMGVTILGTERDKSLVRPWSLSLHTKWIEYVGRSLFLTVLFADLLVRMAVMVWREERAFAGTGPAANFDRTMSNLGTAVETKSAPPVA
jgi:hypothetical protein